MISRPTPPLDGANPNGANPNGSSPDGAHPGDGRDASHPDAARAFEIEAFHPSCRRDYELLRRGSGQLPNSILITGATGTGKEHHARLIHDWIGVGTGPTSFVKIVCPSLAESLIESELFGHVRGAFTGASGVKIGRFEIAGDGTLFLDEIGELSRSIQPKLLEVLDRAREFTRVGDTVSRKVDALIICATNVDIEQAVAQGSFRRDLFERISECHLILLPLRERPQQIIPLVEQFLCEFQPDPNSTPYVLDPSAYPLLLAHPWPGNVRQLRSTTKRAVARATGNVVDADCFRDAMPQDRDASHGRSAGIQPTLDEIERSAIVEALRTCGGDISKASLLLGKSRRVIEGRMKKLAIDASHFRVRVRPHRRRPTDS